MKAWRCSIPVAGVGWAVAGVWSSAAKALDLDFETLFCLMSWEVSLIVCADIIKLHNSFIRLITNYTCSIFSCSLYWQASFSLDHSHSPLHHDAPFPCGQSAHVGAS